MADPLLLRRGGCADIHAAHLPCTAGEERSSVLPLSSRCSPRVAIPPPTHATCRMSQGNLFSAGLRAGWSRGQYLPFHGVPMHEHGSNMKQRSGRQLRMATRTRQCVREGGSKICTPQYALKNSWRMVLCTCCVTLFNSACNLEHLCPKPARLVVPRCAFPSDSAFASEESPNLQSARPPTRVLLPVSPQNAAYVAWLTRDPARLRALTAMLGAAAAVHLTFRAPVPPSLVRGTRSFVPEGASGRLLDGSICPELAIAYDLLAAPLPDGELRRSWRTLKAP